MAGRRVQSGADDAKAPDLFHERVRANPLRRLGIRHVVHRKRLVRHDVDDAALGLDFVGRAWNRASRRKAQILTRGGRRSRHQEHEHERATSSGRHWRVLLLNL